MYSASIFTILAAVSIHGERLKQSQLSASLTSSIFFLSFVFLALDLLISTAFSKIRVATISRSRLSPRRQLVRDIRGELFRIPQHLNIRTNPSSPDAWTSQPLELPVGRAMSRYESRLYFKELPFPLSPFYHQPPFAFLLSMSLDRSGCFLYPFTRYPICVVASTTVVCTAKCASLAKRGKVLS